jgi:hypothetical protein
MELAVYNAAARYVTGLAGRVPKLSKDVKEYVLDVRDLALAFQSGTTMDTLQAIKKAIEILPETDIVKIGVKQARMEVRLVEDKLAAAETKYVAAQKTLADIEDTLLQVLKDRKTPRPADIERLSQLLSKKVVDALVAYTRAGTPVQIAPAKLQSKTSEDLLRQIMALKSELALARSNAAQAVAAEQEPVAALTEPRLSEYILKTQLNLNTSVVVALKYGWNEYKKNLVEERRATVEKIKKRNADILAQNETLRLSNEPAVDAKPLIELPRELVFPTLYEYYQMTLKTNVARATSPKKSVGKPKAISMDPCTASATVANPNALNAFNKFRLTQLKTQLGTNQTQLLRVLAARDTVQASGAYVQGSKQESHAVLLTYLTHLAERTRTRTYDALAMVDRFAEGSPEQRAMRAENLEYALQCLENHALAAEKSVTNNKPVSPTVRPLIFGPAKVKAQDAVTAMFAARAQRPMM